MGGGRGGGWGWHALHAPGPGRPPAPGQEGHGAAHAHLRRPLPEDPGHLPAGRDPRRGHQCREPAHPAGAHRQRHPEEGHRPGHRAGLPRRPCWRSSTPGSSLTERRISALHRRGPDLRHALQGVPPHPEHAAGLLHPHPDRRAGQPAEQRRDRRPAGLHRPPVQRGRQPRDRGHRARRHVLPELADHPGRPGPPPGLPRPGPLRRAHARLAHQGGLRPQLRDEHGDAGALQRRRAPCWSSCSAGPRRRRESFEAKAGRVRDIGIAQATYARVFFVALTLTASLATAIVYGLGGVAAVDGVLAGGHRRRPDPLPDPPLRAADPALQPATSTS